MNINMKIQEHWYKATDEMPNATSRFAFFIEEEIDVFQQYIYGELTPLVLQIKQVTGGCLYALPTKLLQLDSNGKLRVLFDTQKQDYKTVMCMLRCFRKIPLTQLYQYTLDSD